MNCRKPSRKSRWWTPTLVNCLIFLVWVGSAILGIPDPKGGHVAFSHSPAFPLIYVALGLAAAGALAATFVVWNRLLARQVRNRTQQLAAAKERLCASEELYRALVEELPDVVIRFNRDGQHLFVSRNVETLVKMPVTEVIGRTHRDLGYDADQCEFWEDAIRGVFDNGTPFESEFVLNGSNGPTIHNWRLSPECDATGAVRSVLSIGRDVSDYRRVQRDYQTLFREMHNGFALHEIIADGEGTPINYRFLAVNPAFERLTGLKSADVVGRTVLDVLPKTEPRWIDTYGRVALTGEPITFEEYAGELGRHFKVTAFRPVQNQLACIFADVTDRKLAEMQREQLVQADKMAALGALVSGVAHEINNPNNYVVLNAEVLQDFCRDVLPILDSHVATAGDFDVAGTRYSELRHELPKLLEGILDGSRSIQHIVGDLKRFARAELPHLSDSVDLNEVVRSAERLMHAEIQRSTSCFETRYEEGIPLVQGSFQRVEQVVINLLENSCQALESHGAGIRVSVKASPARDAVTVVVEDEGCGIPEELLRNVTDPFFTTKLDAGGTGLGLSVSIGIVKDHGGDLTFEATPSKGTRAVLLLPAQKPEAGAA